MKLQQLTHSPVQSAPALLAKFISHLQVIITWPQSTRSFSFPVPYKTDREDLLGRHQSEQQSLSNSRLGGTLSLISMLTWNCVGPLQKAKHAILLREAGSLNPTGGSPWPDKRMQLNTYVLFCGPCIRQPGRCFKCPWDCSEPDTPGKYSPGLASAHLKQKPSHCFDFSI